MEETQFGGWAWRDGSLVLKLWPNILQEMITIKSDDVIGRAAYESIVKGKSLPSGIPESFNVLLHELRGLGLKVSFE